MSVGKQHEKLEEGSCIQTTLAINEIIYPQKKQPTSLHWYVPHMTWTTLSSHWYCPVLNPGMN